VPSCFTQPHIVYIYIKQKEYNKKEEKTGSDRGTCSYLGFSDYTLKTAFSKPYKDTTSLYSNSPPQAGAYKLNAPSLEHELKHQKVKKTTPRFFF